jgi:pimeloyl-ACP methyl ester carboxylesterase
MLSKLVFVHGAGEVSTVWHYQIRNFLGSDAVSLPGHPQGEAGRSIEEYAGWLDNYIRERHYNDVVLVGHSMGSAIILTCCLKNPERYKGLILIGAGAKFSPLLETIAVLEKAIQGNDEEWQRSFVEKYRLVDPKIRGVLIKKRVSLGPSVQLNDLLCCSRFDVRGKLKEIKLPSLIICGEDDILTPPEYSQYLATNIENSELVIIDGATHQVMLEKPTQVNKAIERFIKKIA